MTRIFISKEKALYKSRLDQLWSLGWEPSEKHNNYFISWPCSSMDDRDAVVELCEKRDCLALRTNYATQDKAMSAGLKVRAIQAL